MVVVVKEKKKKKKKKKKNNEMVISKVDLDEAVDGKRCGREIDREK